MLKDQRGQAMVEMALSFGLVVLLFFGMIDFGRILHASLTLDLVGREASRYWSINAKHNTSLGTRDNAAIKIKDDFVKPELTRYGFSTSSLVVTLPDEATTEDDDPFKKGAYPKISISYEIDILTPIVGNLIGDPFPVTRNSVMRVE